jgi:hypothetical protein
MSEPDPYVPEENPDPDPDPDVRVYEAGQELDLDDIDPDQLNLGEDQLKELDRVFMEDMNQKRETDQCVEQHEASHFWLYVVLLVCIVLLIFWVVSCIREGRAKRLQRRLIGYD